jgi:hypothetical protein
VSVEDPGDNHGEGEEEIRRDTDRQNIYDYYHNGMAAKRRMWTFMRRNVMVIFRSNWT